MDGRGRGCGAGAECCRQDRAPDMREKEKHCRRSGGFIDRRVIVHRSADRGALALSALSASSCAFLCFFWGGSEPAALCECRERSCVRFSRRAPDVPQSVSAPACLMIFLSVSYSLLVSARKKEEKKEREGKSCCVVGWC